MLYLILGAIACHLPPTASPVAIVPKEQCSLQTPQEGHQVAELSWSMG